MFKQEMMVVVALMKYANRFTLLWVDNHAGTSSLSFHRPGALADAKPTVSKH